VRGVGGHGRNPFFNRFFAHGKRRRFQRADVSQEKQISLVHMGAGQSGTVAQIAGWPGMVRRLSAMGVRPGSRITKVSSMFMRGPVTIRMGQTQMAIGFGMARRILVDVD
jgi:ferrous iron transport protein A